MPRGPKKSPAGRGCEHAGCPKGAMGGARYCVAHQMQAVRQAKTDEVESLGEGTAEQLMEELQPEAVERPVAREPEKARAFAQAERTERPERVLTREEREAVHYRELEKERRQRAEHEAERLRPRSSERRSMAEVVAESGADPVLVAAKLAQMRLAQESRERLKAWRQQQVPRSGARGREGERLSDQELLEMGYEPEEVREKARKAQRRATFSAHSRRTRTDITRTPMDEGGREIGAPGKLKRWVRDVDAKGRPSMARVYELQGFGYDFVRDEKNEPIHGILGYLMEADPYDVSDFEMDRAVPGALQRDATLADTEEAIEQGNRAAGAEVARLVIADRHKSERKYHYPKAARPEREGTEYGDEEDEE